MATRITTLLLCCAALVGAQEPPSKPQEAKGPLPASFEVPASAWKGVQREASTLGWAPKVGQVFGYRASTTMQLVQDYGTEDAAVDPVDMTSAQGYRLKVLEVSESHVLVEATATEMVLTLSTGGMTLTSDSRSGTLAGNPGLDAFAEMVGEPFRVKLSAEGRVQEIVDLEQLHERLKAKTVYEDLNFKEVINGTRTAQELQAFFVEFAPGELKSGERWAVERSMQTGPGQTYSGVQTYVYLGVAEHSGVKCAKLLGQFTLSPQLNANPGPNALRKVVASSEPYAIYVDLEDGVVRATEAQALSVEVEQDLGGNPGTVNLSSKTTVEPLGAEELGEGPR